MEGWGGGRVWGVRQFQERGAREVGEALSKFFRIDFWVG